MSKKIFFLANAESIHTVKWVNYFVDSGYEVYLATFASINNTKCKNLYFLGNKKTNISGGNYHYLLSIKKLSNILKAVQPDILNAHYSYSMGLIVLLAKKISKIDTKLSVVCHGSDILDTPNKFVFDRLNRYILKQYDKIFAVSDQIKDKIESFGVENEKIFTGQYGIETFEINTKKDIDIISNRTYNANSRIDFLLSGLLKLKYKNLNIVFVLPTISDKELLKLKTQYPFIKFYSELSYDKMKEMVAQSKIYLSSTLSDGTSLSLLESLDAGCIPIVSNIVSNRSWILDSVNGYLFDTQAEMIEKIIKILTLNKKDYKKIQEINKNIIFEKAYYPLQMKKIEEFLL